MSVIKYKERSCFSLSVVEEWFTGEASFNKAGYVLVDSKKGYAKFQKKTENVGLFQMLPPQTLDENVLDCKNLVVLDANVQGPAYDCLEISFEVCWQKMHQELQSFSEDVQTYDAKMLKNKLPTGDHSHFKIFNANVSSKDGKYYREAGSYNIFWQEKAEVSFDVQYNYPVSCSEKLIYYFGNDAAKKKVMQKVVRLPIHSVYFDWVASLSYYKGDVVIHENFLYEAMVCSCAINFEVEKWKKKDKAPYNYSNINAFFNSDFGIKECDNIGNAIGLVAAQYLGAILKITCFISSDQLIELNSVLLYDDKKYRVIEFKKNFKYEKRFVEIIAIQLKFYEFDSECVACDLPKAACNFLLDDKTNMATKLVFMIPMGVLSCGTKEFKAKEVLNA